MKDLRWNDDCSDDGDGGEHTNYIVDVHRLGVDVAPRPDGTDPRGEGMSHHRLVSVEVVVVQVERHHLPPEVERMSPTILAQLKTTGLKLLWTVELTIYIAFHTQVYSTDIPTSVGTSIGRWTELVEVTHPLIRRDH